MHSFLTFIRKNLALITAIHRWCFIASGGLLGSRMLLCNCLLLENIGRKTAIKRKTPLLYAKHEEKFLLFASNAGQEKPPAWWLNLQSNPEASIRVGSKRISVRARRASQEEYSQMWSKLHRACFWFKTYQRDTQREIPVVVLEPTKLSYLLENDQDSFRATKT